MLTRGGAFVVDHVREVTLCGRDNERAFATDVNLRRNEQVKVVVKPIWPDSPARLEVRLGRFEQGQWDSEDAVIARVELPAGSRKTKKVLLRPNDPAAGRRLLALELASENAGSAVQVECRWYRTVVSDDVCL